MLTKLQFTICFILLLTQAYSQIPKEKELKEKFSVVKDDETRINILGELAELYSIYKDNKKADSILKKQFLLAEASQNETLIANIFASNSIKNIATWSSKESFDRAKAFLKKGLNYAKEQNNLQLEAIAYIKLASLLGKMNLFDQAMEQVTLAFSIISKKDDSLKAALYIELGNAFLGKGDAVAAYKNFNSAYDISYTIKNVPLQSAAWHQFASLYQYLEDTLLAKKALLESLKLNTKNNKPDGLLVDYIDLFKQTDEIEFLKKAMFLADSLQSARNQLYCKRLMFSYIMTVEKNSDTAQAYLKQNQDLNLYMANGGLPNYFKGEVYHYSGQYAKAINYFLLDEPIILKSYEPSVQLSFFLELADCYYKLDSIDKAIEYYSKAYALSTISGNPTINASVTSKLAQLYAKKNDYKNAYSYSQLYQGYSEGLKEQSKQRELALLGLEREKKKHEKDLQEAAEAITRKTNLQYISISIAIAFVFMLMMFLGMFPTSKVFIRMLGFFSFICLFEFILILVDVRLHDFTNGEPLRLWLAKILIIAALVPIHHFLEHSVVRFVTSDKLQRFRKKFSLKKFRHPSKKMIDELEKNFEDSVH